jgi:ankyrin repeat protein
MEEQQDDHQLQEDADSLVLSDKMEGACTIGDVETIVSLLDSGKSVNCSDEDGWTPIMLALRFGRVNAAIALARRGADQNNVDDDGWNALHCAAIGGVSDCINWVFANTDIDVNSSSNDGTTSITFAVKHDELNAAKLLVEKGGNLFMKNTRSESAMYHGLGPQLLQHAKYLIWVSAKPLLLLSASCSANGVAVDPSIVVPSSLLAVLGNSDIVREWIAPYLMRKDIILRDPDDDDDEKEDDDVKTRVEAALAAGKLSRSSSSSK